MASIKIRGRADAVTVSDDQARKIKARKFGDGVPMAESNEMVDLGDWSGEYGRITEIEISRPEKNTRTADQQKQIDDMKRWMAQPASVKARTLGWFKILYAARAGDWKAEAPQHVLEDAVVLQEKLYTANPRLLPMRITTAAYGNLLPPKGKSSKLAEKMRVSYPDETEIRF